MEFGAIGFGYRVERSWAIAGKANATIVNEPDFFLPAMGLGVGVRASKYFDRLTILSGLIYVNSFNIESAYIIRTSTVRPTRNGFAFEVNVGSSNELGLPVAFYWDAGVGLSGANGIEPLLAPCFKLGIQLTP